MTDQIRDFAAGLAEDMTTEEKKVLDISSNHSYDCACNTCLSWWASVGPNGGEPGSYGPFTKEQVNAKQRELGMEETE